MIYFTSYRNLFNLDLTSYDKKLHISYSIKNGLFSGFTQVRALVPSEKLFRKSQFKWKKLKFTSEEKSYMRDGKSGTWFDLFEREFLEEITHREDYQRAYRLLKKYLDEEKNIICVCYCEDYKRCHRSIIARQLREDGYNVIID